MLNQWWAQHCRSAYKLNRTHRIYMKASTWEGECRWPNEHAKNSAGATVILRAGPEPLAEKGFPSGTSQSAPNKHNKQLPAMEFGTMKWTWGWVTRMSSSALNMYLELQNETNAQNPNQKWIDINSIYDELLTRLNSFSDLRFKSTEYQNSQQLPPPTWSGSSSSDSSCPVGCRIQLCRLVGCLLAKSAQWSLDPTMFDISPTSCPWT